MAVYASTRDISGTDTPVLATDDGAHLRATADTVVTLTGTGWVAGRSAIAFTVAGASTSITFTEGAGVTIVAANSDETVDVRYQACVAVYDSANTWVIHKGADPADFEAAGAVSTHSADTTSVHGIADTSALLDAADIGSTVQAHSAVLDGTTASFTTADETKLDGIETGATADQTGAQIKAAYEAEADTNAFDDAAVSKLAGIEASADVTDAGNVAAAGAHMAGGTDVPVADGGTGASNASDARTNLGVAIGSDVQAHDAVLDATTASFTTADETKLDGIETAADVTDEANVTDALDNATLTDVGTPASGDLVLLQDASDTNALKVAQFSEFGGGGGGAWSVIGESTIVSDTTTITFTSIATGYKAFRLTIMGQGAAGGAGDVYVYLNYNNDTGTVYSWQGVGSFGSSGTGQTKTRIGLLPGRQSSTDHGGLIVAEIVNIASLGKGHVSRYGHENTSAGTPRVGIMGGSWSPASQAEISEIDITTDGDFEAGAYFLLEGYSA